MTHRWNHYEAAFEAYLRQATIPYVAVDEARRALSAGASLKSLDFIVSAPGAQRWLVDVKGRRFPGGRRKQYWRNWISTEDLQCLATWQGLFGSEFTGMLIFVFWVCGPRSPVPPDELFCFRDRHYAFFGLSHLQYAPHARMLSPKWQTVAMPVKQFRALAQPLQWRQTVQRATG